MYEKYLNILLLSCYLPYTDPVSLFEIKDAVISSQRTIEDCIHCFPLTEKIAKMENEVYELKMELLEAKKVKSKLQREKADFRQKLSNLMYDILNLEKCLNDLLKLTTDT